MDDNKLEKIRALLAKAESTDQEQEAVLYMEKAQELMFKYRVDQAMIDATLPKEKREKPIFYQMAFSEVPGWSARKQLLLGLSSINSVIAKMWRPDGRDIKAVNLYGMESDIRWVEELYTSITMQMDQAILGRTAGETVDEFDLMFGPGVDKLDVANIHNWKIEFMNGYVERIMNRLRPVSVSGQASVQIVLRNKREEVQSFLTEYRAASGMVAIKSGRSENVWHDPQARAKGADMADKADLGTKKVHSPIRGQLE